MNCAIYAPAAKQTVVSSIHNGVHRLLRDVAIHDRDTLEDEFVRHSSLCLTV